jgi:hypothetical protein
MKNERRNKMLKKRFFSLFLILVLAISVVSGCGTKDNKAASEILQDAFNKSFEMKSYSFDGTMQLNLDIPQELLDTATQDEQMGIEILKNAKLNFKGAYQEDPLQMELILSMDLPIGDMKTSIEVPMLMNEKSMWVKFPNLPIPGTEAFAGKFVEFNFDELAQLSGQPISENYIKQEKKFTREIISIFFKHFEESYFTKIDVDSLSLPDGIDAENAVEFKITQDKVRPFVTTLVEKVLPEIIDIMAKEEYKDLLGISPEMAEQAKQDLSSSKSQLDEGLAEYEKAVKSTNISIKTAVNKDGFAVHNAIHISGDFADPESSLTLKVGIDAAFNTSNINKKPSFVNSIPPAADQVIPFQELMFMGMGALEGSDSSDAGTDTELVDEESSELFDLQMELYAQPWFYENPDITALIESNEEFLQSLEDPEVVRALLDDQAYRAEFFASFGVEVSE